MQSQRGNTSNHSVAGSTPVPAIKISGIAQQVEQMTSIKSVINSVCLNYALEKSFSNMI